MGTRMQYLYNVYILSMRRCNFEAILVSMLAFVWKLFY